MSLAVVFSRASSGISAPLVTVEVHISRGMPNFNIVGLPEAAVKESKYRVRSALLNTHFTFPRGRIIVNLAPADLPKEGGRFDLPIAIGILAASAQIKQTKLTEFEFTGELALSGDIRRVHGILPIVISAKAAARYLIIPDGNREEASLVRHEGVFAAKHVLEVCEFLNDLTTLDQCILPENLDAQQYPLDLADVRGQSSARRALEIAAGGRHSLLLTGPPGTGKTMLASRLPGLLPLLTDEQALDVASIASISSSGFQASQWQQIPFRAPHHTTSSVALVGGGRPPKPGEISLAHHGVLFLDELPEYNRHVLECLREPLESGQVTISRAAFQTVFPARFQLVAAMNPCPCGYAGSIANSCRCTEEQVRRYLTKLSGPLLDRIDMHVEVPPLASHFLHVERTMEEDSASVRSRVLQVRDLQIRRQGKPNAELTVADITQHCALMLPAQTLITQVMEKFNLSARVYHRLLKLARTIADLEQAETITTTHISEALTYRYLDRAQIFT